MLLAIAGAEDALFKSQLSYLKTVIDGQIIIAQLYFNGSIFYVNHQSGEFRPTLNSHSH